MRFPAVFTNVMAALQEFPSFQTKTWRASSTTKAPAEMRTCTIEEYVELKDVEQRMSDGKFEGTSYRELALMEWKYCKWCLRKFEQGKAPEYIVEFVQWLQHEFSNDQEDSRILEWLADNPNEQALLNAMKKEKVTRKDVYKQHSTFLQRAEYVNGADICDCARPPIDWNCYGRCGPECKFWSNDFTFVSK